ncbi:MAG TPA: hypothetical protein VK476_04080, partial [Flavobacterium sp.]|nr:hypothetical protein [Flavobacterium sp.]
MIKIGKYSLQQIKQSLQVKKPWDNVIISVLNILIAIPVFIIVHQNLIDPNWYFQIDRILLFIGIVVVIHVILYLLRTIIIICLALYIVALMIGTLSGNYGFGSVFEDYNYMIYAMNDSPNPQDLILSKLLPF